jgi:MFS transporter, PHS family, inorganic phosphate transporter
MIKQNVTLSDTLNNAPLGPFHLRIVAVVGMGFFTVAYDLFITAPVQSLLPHAWDPNMVETPLLNSVALLTSCLGAIFFGWTADRVGRQAIYGWQALALAGLALLTAISPNLLFLIITRGLLGFVIGGNYPVTAVLVSEYANSKDRGRLVTMAFSMQALALVAGPLITLILLAINLPADLAWRLLLALGALPALLAWFLRRSLPESPRFVSRVKGDTLTAANQLQAYSGGRLTPPRTNEGLRTKARLSQYIVPLIGTAGTWFLFDYAYYGNSISAPLIIKAVAPDAPTITATYWTLVIFLVAAVPGYVMAFNTIDRIGRKTLQMLGFICMGACFLIIGVIPNITQTVVPFLLVFSVSYFFAEFGPNNTTFVLAAELFPVNQRATAHGIAAGIAKLGAFISVFLFPFIQLHLGLSGALYITGAFSIAGCLLTLILREPAGRSLEEASGEDAPQNLPAPAAAPLPAALPRVI